MPGLRSFVEQAAKPAAPKPTIRQLPPPQPVQDPNPYAEFYVPGEIRPDRAHAVPGGSPEAFKNASGVREAQMLWRDRQVVRQYENYLLDNGVSPEEMDEIMRDILLQQKKAREAEYARPVELKLVDNNPKAGKLKGK